MIVDRTLSTICEEDAAVSGLSVSVSGEHEAQSLRSSMIILFRQCTFFPEVMPI